MSKICIFCGSELNELGVCANLHVNKKMCVNCTHCDFSNDTYVCKNEEVMSDVVSKMNEAAKQVSAGFPFQITVEPLPLKNPTKKCPKWRISDEMISEFKNSFS